MSRGEPRRAVTRRIRELQRSLSVEVGHSFSGGVSASHGLVLHGDVLSGQGSSAAVGIVVPLGGDRHIKALIGVL